MTESFIQLPADGVGKKTRTNLLTDVHQQIIQLANSSGTEITEFPLPSSQITTLTPPAAITGFATSSKQDDILTELKNNGISDPSYAYSYDGSGNLQYLDKTIGSDTYRKTFTYTGSDLTAVSTWVLQ